MSTPRTVGDVVQRSMHAPRVGGPADPSHWAVAGAVGLFGVALAWIVFSAGFLPVAVLVLFATLAAAVWHSPLNAAGHVPLQRVLPGCRQGHAVVVLWRPGCPYSARLRRDVTRAGLDVHWVNIWRDREAERLCRRINHGAEATPTVMCVRRGARTPTVIPARVPEIREAVSDCTG